jgi:membrane associated rhomboid family serine protease
MPAVRGPASNVAYTLGPGAPTPAVKALLIATIGLFLAQYIGEFIPVGGEYGNANGAIINWFGMTPAMVLHGYLWQPVSYMFLHAGFMHLIFNMLALWMFGVELERMWGSAFFTKYYFVTGLGAAAAQMLLGLFPGFGAPLYYGLTIGASGAVYGILLAYALYFPTRPIYMYMVFPIPAKYFVMIMGGISLLSSIAGPGGVAHWAHLGGLVTGYLFLKGRRFRLSAEIQYRLSRWRIDRARRRFDVHRGGRTDDRNRRIH